MKRTVTISKTVEVNVQVGTELVLSGGDAVTVAAVYNNCIVAFRPCARIPLVFRDGVAIDLVNGDIRKRDDLVCIDWVATAKLQEYDQAILDKY